MKIYSFTTVKDEEDIIESFVRYNMNILDGMVISDNCSNDNTLEILKKLKKEGYNIEILQDTDSYFNQYIKRNELMNYTIKKYHPDFIFPLDCDEFIASNNNTNPRETIEKLDKKYLYYYKMENYVLTKENTSDEIFVPKRIKKIRDVSNKYKDHVKCFISDKIYDKGIDLVIGAHSVQLLDDREKEISSKKIDEIYLAHYPVRSKTQYINKVINGRLNNLSLHSREEESGYHQYNMFDHIIKTGTISDQIFYDYCKYYDITKNIFYKKSDRNQILGLKEKEMHINFCKNLKLKYTPKKQKIDDELIIANAVRTAKIVIDRMRNDKRNLNTKIEELEISLQGLENEREYYKEQHEKVVNSKGWKYLEKIRKIRNKLFRIK